MFHKTDVLTDTKGNSLVGYQVALRNSDNGTTIPIYADENGTPIQSVSGVANAALTDNAGNWSLWVDFGTYDIDYRTPDGTTMATVRKSPMNGGAQGATGPALATFETLAAFRAAPSTNLSQNLADPAYSSAGYTFETSGAPYVESLPNTIKADDAPLSVGAWVRQKSNSITFSAPVTAPVVRPLETKAQEIPVAPEDKGGIQAALDAVTTAAGTGSSGGQAPVQLRQFTRYSITSPMTLNTMRASLIGYSTINAAGTANNTATLTINSTADSEYSSSYGYKGRIWGNVRFQGGTVGGSYNTNGKVGLDFNGSVASGSAQMDVNGAVVTEYQTGVRFSNHAYNSTFYRFEAFRCGTAVSWPAGGTDNAERNTFISSTLYNSDTAISNSESAGEIFYYGGSIDYTLAVAKVVGGKVFLTNSHLESSRWGPYVFEASGDGGLIQSVGSAILSTATMTGAYLAYINNGARIDIDGGTLHNIDLTRAAPTTPTAFFNGPGRGYIRNTHGFDGGLIPDRLSALRTDLVDPGFEQGLSIFPDLIWIAADQSTITGRRTGTAATITKVASNPKSGTNALKLLKNTGYGGGSIAQYGIICGAVQPGQKVMAGFNYRNDAASGTLPGVRILWQWAKFDRYDAVGNPIWFWAQDALNGLNGGGGEDVLGATQTYQMSVYGKVPGTANNRIGLGIRTAPEWATHFVGILDCFNMNQTTALLIDDVWFDTW